MMKTNVLSMASKARVKTDQQEDRLIGREVDDVKSQQPLVGR